MSSVTPSTVQHTSEMNEVSPATKQEPDDLHQRQRSDATHDVSESHEEERTMSCKIEKDLHLPMQKPSSNSELLAQQSKLKSRVLEKLQPRRNPDTGGSCSQSDQVSVLSSVSEKLSIIPKEKPKTNSLQPRQCLDAGNHAFVSKEEKNICREIVTVPENLIEMPTLSVGVPVLQSDQQNLTHFKKSEKVEKLQPRRNPDPGVQVSQIDAESTPSRVVEKGLDDGYNWRKYGQKLVKGNEFVRSYYKCTFPSCQAKKQVERSYDWCKTEVNYLGKHEHPKPQPNPQVIPEMAFMTASKTGVKPSTDHGSANQHMTPTETSGQSIVARSGDGVARAVSPSNDNSNDKDVYPDSKRQKRETTSVDDNLLNRPSNDFRHVVQTLSEVDLVNDGYRWRKYGQKLVKGNPNPRSYYRCSNAGCPVKKHVERASHDPKVVITTYEGKHVHDIPPSRTVTQTTAGADATKNEESRSKPGETNPNSVGLEMVLHVSAN
ncbi:hypothetical protein BUALT_Bualt03G0229600 [Buddleja alternifolia]|uniref:WRKY domain-containing protein n=1 Tax=Buddleja alternifolia TaxID=168488 RepID=A0AAV6Y2W6_9LAMI|nr:hypothetical protein BUALT_Bualt03G0229600 [Buddleja alternifolia]